MWNVVSVRTDRPEDVSPYLKDGYEPFAVSTNYNLTTLWLRKEVNFEIPDKRPKPVKRASRRTAKKSKGQTSS